MNRNEVKEKLEKVRNAISEIENSDNVYTYITQEKYLPGVGYIKEIETIGSLINAHMEIKANSKNDISESVRELGLNDDEIPENKVRILGFKPEHWLKDIQTRLNELRELTRLKKLKSAEKALLKHLSDDDKFQMDTDGIDELI